jgi:hypothetical protein
MPTKGAINSGLRPLSMSGGIAVASIAVPASYTSAGWFIRCESVEAYGNDDVGLDVVLGTLSGQSSGEADQSHYQSASPRICTHS